MENDKKKSDESLKRMDQKAIRLGLAALTGILGLPYLVTQCSLGYSLEVNNANEIGDTIGGILGPFIGLISSILVYLALREQIKANNLIQEQFEKEKVEREERLIFEVVKNELDVSINYLSNLDDEPLQNSNANNKANLQNIVSELLFEKNENNLNNKTIEEFKAQIDKIANNLEQFVDSVSGKTFHKIIQNQIQKINFILQKTNLTQIDNLYRQNGSRNDFLILNSTEFLNFYARYTWSEYKIQSNLSKLTNVEINNLKGRGEWLNEVITDLNETLNFEIKFKDLISGMHSINFKITKGQYEPRNVSSIYEQRTKLEKDLKNLETSYKTFLEELELKQLYNVYSLKHKHIKNCQSNVSPWYMYKPVF